MARSPAHLLGFGRKMLSGAKVHDPGISAAFCGPGETLLGWIALGTPARSASGPSRKGGATQALQEWG